MADDDDAFNLGARLSTAVVTCSQVCVSCADDIDALLEGAPVPAVGTTKSLDYGKWDRATLDADADAVVDEPSDEHQRIWERMVDASGLREELKDELDLVEEPSNVWKVVHTPYVAIREEPSVRSKMLGAKRCGDIIHVEWSLESLWVKLKDEAGWMLTHGGELGLGQLLMPSYEGDTNGTKASSASKKDTGAREKTQEGDKK